MILLKLLTRVLQGEGHVVETTDDLQEALQVVQSSYWDLIITDRTLKGGCGEDFARRVNEAAQPPPMLLMTGSARFVNDPALFRGVLCKPFSLNEFMGLINPILLQVPFS